MNALLLFFIHFYDWASVLFFRLRCVYGRVVFSSLYCCLWASSLLFRLLGFHRKDCGLKYILLVVGSVAYT